MEKFNKILILASALLLFLFINPGHTQTEDSLAVIIGKPSATGSDKSGAEDKNQEVKESLSLEEITKISDIIVVGKTAAVGEKDTLEVHIGKLCDKTQEELEAEAARNYKVNSIPIEISRVLKGDKNMKTVLLVIPSHLIVAIGDCRDRLSYWKGITYKEGLEGIWLLTKNPYKVPGYIIKAALSKDDYYFAEQKESYREIDEILIEKITNILMEAGIQGTNKLDSASGAK